MKILRQSQYEYLEEIYERFKRQALIFLGIGLGIGILGIVAGGGGGFIFGILFLILAFERWKRGSNYIKGIEGEKAVIGALGELDDSWILINDIKLTKQHGNIDHILLSPKGIFLIETKNYGGSVRCYGDNWIILSKRRYYGKKRRFEIRSASRQVKFQASLLHGLLKRKLKLDIPITPVCVFTDPEVKLQINKPSVKVLKLKDLVGWLQKTRLKSPLTEKEINLISQSILEKSRELDTKSKANYLEIVPREDF